MRFDWYRVPELERSATGNKLARYLYKGLEIETGARAGREQPREKYCLILDEPSRHLPRTLTRFVFRLIAHLRDLRVLVAFVSPSFIDSARGSKVDRMSRPLAARVRCRDDFGNFLSTPGCAD